MATVALASLLARLPLSMMGLATVFFVESKTGSAAVAGFAVAAFSVAAAVFAPWRGRFVDRRGLRHGLLPLALAHAAATGALLLVAPLSSEAVFFVLVSALGGATAPPVNAAMRALWPALVDVDRLDAAYGAEAVLQEIAYLSGPLVTGVLVAAFSVAAPIVVATILTAVGGSLFSFHRAAARLRPVSAPRRTPHRHAGMRVILGSLALAALAAGILEVAIPTFSDEHGTAASAGVLIAAMSAASLIGGLWYGTRHWHISAAQRFIAASAIAGLGYVAMIPATSAPALGVGLVIFGSTLAPTLAAVYSILDDVVPAGSGVEAVTWITSATAGGAAIGAAIGGLTIERFGLQAALGLGALSLLLATAVPIVWRHRIAGDIEARQTGTEVEPA